MHVEYGILNLSLIIRNINYLHSEYNNCGEDSRMILLDDEHSCDTIISENKILSRNNEMEIIDSVLPYLHIGGAKYRI